MTQKIKQLSLGKIPTIEEITVPIHTSCSIVTHSVFAVATFGAGCFWHTEEAFRSLLGVVHTSVGYMGGHFANPCYLDVLSRITGHAEVAQLQYDLALISYEDLLKVFWACHDPTTLNRQGPDRGEQYRSVIFCHTAEQFSSAQHSKASMNASNTYPNPVVTQVREAGDYWLATEDHQQYFYKKRLTTST